MRRQILGFAGRTYHIVGNLMAIFSAIRCLFFCTITLLLVIANYFYDMKYFNMNDFNVAEEKTIF